MVTTGGGGGGGEKKEEGFGFIGGGSMKDWLIIMVVVVVGLMFLTHSTGIPGQKGPNGGFAAFAETGQLIGSMMQWATFLFANPGIILFAFACRSKTFRKLFPLGLIHDDLGITGFCKRFEKMGEFSLYAMIYDPQRACKLQAVADQIAVNKASLVEDVFKDKTLSGKNEIGKNVKLLLSSTDHLGTLTPEMAKATNIEEWNKALKDALSKNLVPKGLRVDMKSLTEFIDNPKYTSIINNTKLVNAVTSTRALKSTGHVTNGWATLKTTIANAEGMKVTDTKKMLAFFASNPVNLQGVHNSMNIPTLVGEAERKRFKTLVTTATASGDIKAMTKNELAEAFSPGVPRGTTDAMAEAIASLTKDQLRHGLGVLDDLKNSPAVQSNDLLKKAVDDLSREIKQTKNQAVREGLESLKTDVNKELEEATRNVLKDIEK